MQFRGKEPALYFSNKPTHPAGGANPPSSPPQKKKKEKEKRKKRKRIIILLHASKIEEKTRHWFLLHPF